MILMTAIFSVKEERMKIKIYIYT